MFIANRRYAIAKRNKETEYIFTLFTFSIKGIIRKYEKNATIVSAEDISPTIAALLTKLFRYTAQIVSIKAKDNEAMNETIASPTIPVIIIPFCFLIKSPIFLIIRLGKIINVFVLINCI